MKCMFLRRGAAPEMDFLTKIWEGSSLYYGKYRSSSTSAKVSLSQSDIPNTGVVYLFAIFDGSLSIWKFKDGVLNTTPILKHPYLTTGTFAAYYGHAICHNTDNNTYYLNRLPGRSSESQTVWYETATGSGTGTGSEVNGAYLALIQFTAGEAGVDAVLSKMNCTTLAHYNDDTTGSVSAAVSDCLQYKIVLAQGFNLSIWKNDTSTITNLWGSGMYISNGNLRNSQNTYGGSIIGFN